MSEFLAMGGYGAYVWTAFGVALVVLIGLLAHSLRLVRLRDRELAQLRDLARPSGADAGGIEGGDPEALEGAPAITPRRPSEAAERS